MENKTSIVTIGGVKYVRIPAGFAEYLNLKAKLLANIRDMGKDKVEITFIKE